MFTALLKSAFVLVISVMTTLGTAGVAVFIALVFGIVEMSQVVNWLQLGVDNSHYALTACGGATALATARALIPFAVKKFWEKVMQIAREAASGK